MKRTTAAIVIGTALVAALTMCDRPDDAELISAPSAQATLHDGVPPRQYRGSGEARVIFSDNVGQACVDAGHDIGFRGNTRHTNACAILGGRETILIGPNPCKESGSYARAMCHELGHANGWPANHPQ